VIGGVKNDPDLVQKLVHFTSRGPTTDLIRNLDAQMEIFAAGGTTFPLSISDPPNCYLCCPSTGYIDYALEETRHFTNRKALEFALANLIKGCKPLVRDTGLDHQVQPNNWLFSTNPVPLIDAATAHEIKDTLIRDHPSRAIVIRSLNDLSDAQSIASLRSARFQMLPARQVYLVDPGLMAKPTRDMKSDAQLIAQSEYSQVDAHSFSADDWTRAAMLYDMLYLGKYSGLNPEYTPSFMAQAHQIGLMQIVGLRGPDDRLDGVIGMFTNGGTMTAPILGHDTTVDQSVGLYRMLTSIAQTHAANNGLLYNRSAGAAAFKRNRGAQPAIEYNAVYVDHLGIKARIATKIVRSILTRVGVPIMKRFAL
jgi:hypothetical protein